MKKIILLFIIALTYISSAQEFTIGREKFYTYKTEDGRVGESIGLFLGNGSFLTYSNLNIQDIAKFTSDMEPQWIRHFGYYDVLDPRPWNTQITINVQSIVDSEVMEFNSYIIAGYYYNSNSNINNAFYALGVGNVAGIFIDTTILEKGISNFLYAGRTDVENPEKMFFFVNTEKIGSMTYLKVRRERTNATMYQNPVVDSTLGMIELSRLFQKGNFIEHVLLYSLGGNYHLSVTKTTLNLEPVSHMDFTLPAPVEERTLQDVSILVKNNTSYYVLAKANINSRTSKMIYLAEANCSDNSVRAESIPLEDYFDLNGAIVDAKSNIIAAGIAWDLKTSLGQFALMAIDKNLNLKCTHKWSYQASSILNSIAYNGTDILVGGYFFDTTDVPSTTYFAKLRYNDEVGVSARDDQAGETAMQAYCESGRLYINLRSPAAQTGSATVTGLLGNTVARASIDGCFAEIDLSANPSGVYFVNVVTGGRSYTSKVIKD